MKHHAMKTYKGWRYNSTHSDLVTRRRWVVSLTPRPLYPRRKNFQYSFDWRLGGLQSRCWGCGEKKNICPVGKRAVQNLSSDFLRTGWVTTCFSSTILYQRVSPYECCHTLLYLPPTPTPKLKWCFRVSRTDLRAAKLFPIKRPIQLTNGHIYIPHA
jgi:hypothetical protein